jgi:hypothetical protein
MHKGSAKHDGKEVVAAGTRRDGHAVKPAAVSASTLMLVLALSSLFAIPNAEADEGNTADVIIVTGMNHV